MKRSWDYQSGGQPSAPLKRPTPVIGAGGSGAGGAAQVAIKMLFTPAEASSVQGEHNETAQLLENLTSAKVKFSPEPQRYPGTDLREVTIIAPNLEALVNAACLALAQIAGNASGTVTGGEAGVESGGARVKVVVPAEAATGLKTGGGLGKMQAELGVTGTIVPTLMPPGEVNEMSEQVVCLSGSLNGVHEAMHIIAEPLGKLMPKSWFRQWATRSLCGLQIPGLVLLDDEPGASSASRRSQWDEGPGGRVVRSQWDEGAPGGARALAAAGGGAGSSSPAAKGHFIPGLMLMKLLISQEEAAVLRAFLPEIQQSSGAELVLASEGELYPGSALQELAIQGGSTEAIVTAATDAFNKIVDGCGALTCGELIQEPSGARIKFIVPAKATSAVIGPQGRIVSQIRSQTGMHVHVETTMVPPGPPSEVSEQVVSFDGPLTGVHTGLLLMADITSQFVSEPWYSAWAAHSHSGTYLPGFSLFADGKGKGGKGGKAKGKGKDLGKDSGKDFGWPPSHSGPPTSHAAPSFPSGPVRSSRSAGGLTLKLLVSPNEGSCILGRGGTAIREIMASTGARLGLSGRNEFFPGCQLQELKVQGPTGEAVVNGCLGALSKMADPSGAVTCGESNVEPGTCRLKVVVPHMAAASIIGPGGVAVKKMREATGLYVHIEEAIIPPGPPMELSEQVVCLSGPLEGAYMAFTMIGEVVSHLMGEPWFDAWAANSHCGLVIPGLTLFADPKGKGKGKVKGGPGKDGGGGGGPKGFGFKGGKGHGAPHVVPPAISNVAYRDGGDWDRGSGEWAAHDGGGVDAGHANEAGGPMAVKVLVAPEDVAVLGQDPAAMAEIQQATSTTGMLSDKSYPGSSLQELTVQGPNADSVFNALLLILNRIAEVTGAVRSGEANLPPGDAAVKLVVPKRAAAAIIGPAGQNVRQIKVQTGIRISVDMNTIPCGDKAAEQAVFVGGPFANIHMALSHVITEVANLTKEPWFELWAAHSNAGLVIPGLTLFDSSKGKGKGGFM